MTDAPVKSGSVAKLAYAYALGAYGVKPVEVRVLSDPQIISHLMLKLQCCKFKVMPSISQIVNRSPRFARCKRASPPATREAGKSLIGIFAALLIFFSLFTFHLLALSLPNGSLISAQTTPLEQAKSNYILSLTKFNKAKEEYITAKSNYTAFQTATSKGDAFSKTKEYLLSGDDLLLVYLALVSAYGNESVWQSTSFDKIAQDNTILDETAFITNHRAITDSSQTLEQLPPLAQELKKQLENSTKPKIGKIIVAYDISQTEYTFESFRDTTQTLNDLVEKRISPENHTLLLNWQSEINDIREKTETNLSLAIVSYTKIKEDKNNSTQIKQTDKITQIAKDELKRSRNLFEEMTKIL